MCPPPPPRVDDDLATTLGNLEAGEGELWKKHDSLSYKWLVAKVAAVLFAFLLVFLIFV
jgi:hypothetical protein